MWEPKGAQGYPIRPQGSLGSPLAPVGSLGIYYHYSVSRKIPRPSWDLRIIRMIILYLPGTQVGSHGIPRGEFQSMPMGSLGRGDPWHIGSQGRTHSLPMESRGGDMVPPEAPQGPQRAFGPPCLILPFDRYTLDPRAQRKHATKRPNPGPRALNFLEHMQALGPWALGYKI